MLGKGGRKLEVFHTLLKYDAVAFVLYCAVSIALKDHPNAIPDSTVIATVVGGANGLGMAFMAGNGMEHMGGSNDSREHDNG